MFVQFVLEPLWQTYHAALELKVSEGILEEVIKDLQILLQAVKILITIHVEILTSMSPGVRGYGTAVACDSRVYVLGGSCDGDFHYHSCVFYFDCALPDCG
ncbi:hypothetical protein V6N13_132773 [Hibiscus sabdariffa]|uniref:Uncharacterized protein n=1 Tax=Hibiscus sabdariffa TaxID=183260 RepID=A0ABR2PWR3_9ROSI